MVEFYNSVLRGQLEVKTLRNILILFMLGEQFQCGEVTLKECAVFVADDCCVVGIVLYGELVVRVLLHLQKSQVDRWFLCGAKGFFF